MKVGWRLVAKLGDRDPHFPHLLVDPYGWGLRLNSNPHAGIKYFSSLPTLWTGLVEHAIRQNLGAAHPILSVPELAQELRNELAFTREVEFFPSSYRKDAI
jgi:hypothetical protein